MFSSESRMPRLRSNESPSGAFKRQSGLAPARWRGLTPTSSGSSRRLCVRNLINKDVSQKSHMKYDERACKFNMDTGCVELLLRDGRKISIDCTGVEDALDVTMAQRSELDYLVYNDPLGYADLILNGDPEEYLKNVTGSCGLED